MAGAERAGAPVILAISHNSSTCHGSLAPLASACLAIARASASPWRSISITVARTGWSREAIGLGIDSVMFDASALDDVAERRGDPEVAGSGIGQGIWVEAELGEVGGKDGVHSATARTDPAAAATYVGADRASTRLRWPSARRTRDRPATQRSTSSWSRRLRAAVPVPLVLHGSSGVPDDGLAAAVRAGLTKVNIATQLNRVFTSAVRRRLADDPPRRPAPLSRGGVRPSRRRSRGC